MTTGNEFFEKLQIPISDEIDYEKLWDDLKFRLSISQGPMNPHIIIKIMNIMEGKDD